MPENAAPQSTTPGNVPPQGAAAQDCARTTEPARGRPADAASHELGEILDLLSERIARYRVDDLRLLYCNAAWAAQHAASPADLVGRSLEDLLSPAELDGLHSQLARLGPQRTFAYDEVPRPAPHVPGRWVEWADRWLEGPDGPQIIAVGRDVTDRHEAEERLALSEAMFRDLADRSADLVWRVETVPEPHITYVSPSVRALTGWAPEEVTGHLSRLLGIVDEDGAALLRDGLDGERLPDRFDLRVRRPHGGWVVLEMQVSRVPAGLQGIGRDVTEIRSLQADLAELALRDPLTGLANRRLLEILAAGALGRVAATGGELSALYVDLEDFKAVNDTYGHEVGDAVLVEAAARLTAAVPEADVVARLGGDEFLVVHEPADGVEADRRRRAVAAALAEPYRLPDGTTVRCGATLGEARRGGEVGVPGLVAAADRAMYRSKRGTSR